MLQLPDVSGIGNETVRAIALIARREFITRVRSRFFVIGTVLLMVLLVGYIVLQARIFSQVTSTVKVGLTGDAQVLAAPLQAVGKAEGLKVETSDVASLSGGQDQVRSGSLDVLVSGDPAAPAVAVKDKLDPTLAATLNALVKQVALNRALAAAGVNPSTINTAVAGATIHLAYLDPNATQRTQREVVGIFVAVLLYVALLIYGQVVASGVVEEKANRIVEILLTTVRPRQLLLGKVLGIGLMGFLQLLLVGAAALVAVTKTQVVAVPSAGFVAVAGGLLWFVLGFVFFALIYAAAGSLVSRQEDIGAVVAPMSMLMVGTYLAFFWVLANPDNPIGIALSMIPPFAPILMPARMATGDALAWQVGVGAVLTVATIAGINALAARIYSNSVLRVGTRVNLLEAWRGAR